MEHSSILASANLGITRLCAILLFMNCPAEKAVHTIGHSTRALPEFIGLLAAHRIEGVVDVRRWPASRRYPHFSREPLQAALGARGVAYDWRGDLGGFRKPEKDSPNTGWRVGAFRAYADFMLTEEFAQIMDAMEVAACAKRIALLCAEAVPWRCHRQLLADAFAIRGWSVGHIMDAGCHEHRLPDFARVNGTRIIYAAVKMSHPGSAGSLF